MPWLSFRTHVCECSSYKSCSVRYFSKITPTPARCAATHKPACRSASTHSSARAQHGHPLGHCHALQVPVLPKTPGCQWDGCELVPSDLPITRAQLCMASGLQLPASNNKQKSNRTPTLFMHLTTETAWEY